MYIVAGLGKTGLSFAHYLQKRKANFVVYDTRANPSGLETFKQAFPGLPIYLEQIPANIIAKAEAILVSPGLPLETPLLQEARVHQIPIYGDIECLAKAISAPVIAITGTNGKSTVTALVGEMALCAGFKVAVAGNIGEPVLEKLDDGQSYDLWVLELSSFQLDLTYSLKPKAATILNVSPDHLDRHHTLELYIQAKQRIYNNAEYLIYNRQDKQTYPMLSFQADTAREFTFGEDKPNANQWGLLREKEQTYLAENNKPFLAVTDLRIKGRHNWLNALAACALASQVGISKEIQKQVLQNFKGLKHRCEWVRTLNGVEWINDSKGTNIGATISAISGIGGSMQGKIVLIAGGQGKGADFNLLQETVNAHVRAVVLIGQDKDKIAQALEGIVPLKEANDFEEAIKQAEKLALPGDVVLLSPACASLDMFKDFNHRGESFMDLVQGL